MIKEQSMSNTQIEKYTMEKRVKLINQKLLVLKNKNGLSINDKRLLYRLNNEKIYDLGFLFDMYMDYKNQLEKKVNSMERRIKKFNK